MNDPIVIDVHGGLEGRVTHEEIPAWLRELPTDGEG
jgi:hypothetical protein